MTELAEPQKIAPKVQRASQWQLAFMFYMGWPALLGLLLGWTGAGEFGGQLPRLIAIAYWIVGFILLRLSLEASIRLVALLAPKGVTPLVVLCLLSIPLHVLLITPLTFIWQIAFIDFLPEANRPEIGGFFLSGWGQFVGGLQSSVVIAVEWTLCNYVFDRFLGFGRFRHVTGYQPPQHRESETLPQATQVLSKANSHFLRKVPDRLGMDINALSAEDHYVKVYTSQGHDLVLYRFSDAIAEMPEGVGIRVHRSHWVSKSAIESFESRENGHVLKLRQGLEVPVSKRYLELVKANGYQPSSTTTT